MLEQLKSGVAVLEAAHVTPLCLTILASGEWHFYKTVALPGHPAPGNAKAGFSHPMPLSAPIHRRASWRELGKLDALPQDRAAVDALGREIGAALWPGAWTVYIEGYDDGYISAMDVCRRVTDQALLVAMRIACGERSTKIAMRGGRP